LAVKIQYALQLPPLTGADSTGAAWKIHRYLGHNRDKIIIIITRVCLYVCPRTAHSQFFTDFD